MGCWMGKERWLELKEIKKNFIAAKVSDKEILSIIKEVYEKDQFVLDPHTATAFGAINKNNDILNIVALGTAHPYKFFETVKEATGHCEISAAENFIKEI